MAMRAVATLCCVLLLAACGSLQTSGPKNVLIPNQTLNLSKALTLPLESMAAVAALYYVIDPLAPNWQVSHARVDERHFRVSLKMKALTSGGEGEARQIFTRQAQDLARSRGDGRYTIMEYTEGIESELPFARRVASGVVRVR